MKKNLIILLIILTTFKISAYENKLAGIINNEAILTTELKIHHKVLKLLFNLDSSIYFSELALDDLFKIKMQLEKAKEKKIEFKASLIENVYDDYVKRSKLPYDTYKNYLKKKAIKKPHLEKFIQDTIFAKKLHEKVLFQKIQTFDKKIYDFIKISNNESIYRVKNFEIMEIKLNNKKKENIDTIEIALLFIKDPNAINLYNTLIKKNLIMTNYNLDANKDVFPNISIKGFIKNEIIGPIFKNKKIHIFKILDKNFSNELTNFRTIHCFIKKEYSDEIDHIKKEQKYEKKRLERIKGKLLKKNKINNSICKYEWINIKTTNETIYNNIKDLEKDNISDVFEDFNGMHIIKIIEKEFDSTSRLSMLIKEILRNVNYRKLAKDLIHSYKNETYIEFINE